MLRTLGKVTAQVVESMLSVVGVRSGTEEPQHTSTPLHGRVEVRRYGPRIAAETIVDADEDAARNEGFRRLARYIFGRNHHVETGRSDKVAMTAPVTQSAELGDAQTGWAIRFIMPSTETLQSLPQPDDDRVRLIPVPAETYAVLTFSGDRGPRAVAEHTHELLNTLRANNIMPTGDAAAWFYDPPWTLPFRRRNEIAIPIEPH